MDTKKKHIKELKDEISSNVIDIFTKGYDDGYDDGTLDNLHTVQEAFKDINKNIFTKEEILEELQKTIDKLGV